MMTVTVSFINIYSQHQHHKGGTLGEGATENVTPDSPPKMELCFSPDFLRDIKN